MTESIIDVWNIDTFDDVLLASLYARSEVVRQYMVAEKRNFVEYVTAERWQPLQSNSYAPAYQDFVERSILPAMEKRTIRAWHYTRLTDAEVELLRSGGIYMPTTDTIRMRLTAQIAEGSLSPENANALYEVSPFHKQNEARANKFWMTSHPQSIDDSGVTLFLEHWGGEGVYFWLQDADLIELVEGIGKPRVIEVAVPIDTTNRAYEAARAVIATFAQTLGCKPAKAAFDLYSSRSLGPETVVNIHAEGEPNFAILARGYPASFIPSTDD